MYSFNTLQKKRKGGDIYGSSQGGFRRLKDIAREEQEEWHDANQEESSAAGSFTGNEDEEMQDAGSPPLDDDVTWSFTNMHPSSKSYREKQEQLYAEWAKIHEELGWQLLCFQGVGDARELPPCACPKRTTKKIECIGLESKHPVTRLKLMHKESELVGRSSVVLIIHADCEIRDIFYCKEHPIHSALVRAGYFPASPESPKKAFHIRVLELYRHLLASGVSHQAWCIALWNMHNKTQGTVSITMN
jgi:hypothetical protein